MVAASDTDASRIQRLRWSTIQVSFAALSDVFLSWLAAATRAVREPSLMDLSVVAGVELAPGWRSQISDAPSGRHGVFISPQGVKLKGYKDVLRYLGLPTESQLAAVLPVDNSERNRSDYAQSTITATVSVCMLHILRYISSLCLSAGATASVGCAQPECHLLAANVKGKLCSHSGPGAGSTACTMSPQNACMPVKYVQGRLATRTAQGTDFPEMIRYLFCKGH